MFLLLLFLCYPLNIINSSVPLLNSVLFAGEKLEDFAKDVS